MTFSVLVSVFILILLIYLFTEIHYFTRTLLSYLHSKLKKKLDILDTAMYSSICLTTDVDILLFHMNNARYLRELDFARTDFYNRTNLWQTIREHGGQVFQGATMIRYRRFIKLFSLYQISTKIVYWDQSAIYMEHRFVTKSDNFVRAIVYGKQAVVKCNLEEVMIELMKDPADEKALEARQKPECPAEIRLWIESISASSSKLRSNAEV